MSVLTDPLTDVVVIPEGATLPDAVVYLRFGNRHVLADLTTPIYDRIEAP